MLLSTPYTLHCALYTVGDQLRFLDDSHVDGEAGRSWCWGVHPQEPEDSGIKELGVGRVESGGE